jgi:hypothetical protein
MSTDRQFAGWVQVMEQEKMLKGKTLGVINADPR